MVVRLIRPEKQGLTNLNFSCNSCKTTIARPGIDNKWCSYQCMKASLSRPRKHKKKNKKFTQSKQLSREYKTITSKFFNTRKWKELRYQVLKKYGRKCMVCFATNTELHVDHIKPLSKYPELALCSNNLQVLCKLCNQGKSNKDMTDWRS